MENLNLKIVIILTFGFGLASFLGYFSQKARLSPILGYLLAGYAIGPFSPGFVADLKVAEGLAEIGVILMMFSVGLHFKWQDLLKFKNIALPGAVGQTLVATIFGIVLIQWMGWSFEAGILFGLAIGVASTVVLVRILTDNHLLNTQQGHIAVGWLIVEDLITIAALLLVPSLAYSINGKDFPLNEVFFSFALSLFKFLLLTVAMFTMGQKVISFVLAKVYETKSHELFTLTILALTFFIAIGSALALGTSIALGAFLAGMVIGQNDIRHQVSTSMMPLKDTFVVIFFLAIGMLFNPAAILDNFLFFLGALGIILIMKPLAAYIITRLLKYPFKVALTIALALAQIGEFSFILAEEASTFKILPDEGYDIIVACAFVAISINPLLFTSMNKFIKSE
jgi:monovalent cation:H+ antiporter-2, CPA2 family